MQPLLYDVLFNYSTSILFVKKSYGKIVKFLSYSGKILSLFFKNIRYCPGNQHISVLVGMQVVLLIQLKLLLFG